MDIVLIFYFQIYIPIWYYQNEQRICRFTIENKSEEHFFIPITLLEASSRFYYMDLETSNSITWCIIFRYSCSISAPIFVHIVGKLIIIPRISVSYFICILLLRSCNVGKTKLKLKWVKISSSRHRMFHNVNLKA